MLGEGISWRKSADDLAVSLLDELKYLSVIKITQIMDEYFGSGGSCDQDKFWRHSGLGYLQNRAKTCRSSDI